MYKINKKQTHRNKEARDWESRKRANDRDTAVSTLLGVSIACATLTACHSVQYSCPLKDTDGRCLSQTRAYMQSIAQEDKHTIQDQSTPMHAISITTHTTCLYTDFINTHSRWIWIVPTEKQHRHGMRQGYYIPIMHQTHAIASREGKA